MSSRGPLTRWFFAGFVYQEPFVARYDSAVRQGTREIGWAPVMPLGSTAQGLMLDRIAAMIRSSEKAIYDVSVDNGNVWFELGITLARRQPAALLTSIEPNMLPDLIRTPFLRHYLDDDHCVREASGFLDLTAAPPIVAPNRHTPRPNSVMVVGEGGRADVLAATLQDSGYQVEVVAPRAIRSVAEAVEVAEAAERIVVARPPGDNWAGAEAMAALLMLGAGYELRRECVLAAGDGEWIPSDCPQLVVRGSNDDTLAEIVAAAFRRPRPSPPPSGTMRPRITDSMPRHQAVLVADAIEQHGVMALDSEPGYGKTTVLDQVAGRLGLPVAWISVGQDWTVTKLVEGLVSAVGEHVPGFGWEVISVLRAIRLDSHSADEERTLRDPSPSADQLAEGLAKSVNEDSRPGRVLLVIDDAHRLVSDADRLVAGLIRVAPQWLRLAVAGRGMPENLMKALAERGHPIARASDLVFGAEETDAYLRLSLPGIDESWVGLLHARTEGWPVALAVIRAWLGLHPEATLEQLQAMTRGDRSQIYRLFASEYFVSLPDAVRTDLLAASLPLRLDNRVAIKVFGEGGGLRLRELSLGPYFLTEDAGGLFRFHSMFRQFLSARWAEERGQADLTSTRTELARWYLAEGDQATAYQIAIEAENWEAAADAIEPVSRALASQGDAVFLLDVLGRLPDSMIRTRRPLWESWARALSYSGDNRGLEELRALANSEAPNALDRAIAELLYAEARYEKGELSDSQMAAECDRIAASLGPEHASIAIQARLQSLGVRVVHNADAEQWPGLSEEAEALGQSAETLGMPTIAAGAYVEAGELISRMYETGLSQEAAQLKLLAAMGYEVILEARAARARQYIRLSDRAIEMYKRAFESATRAAGDIVLARVQLSYSRFITYAVIQSIWRGGADSGVISEETRGRGEEAIGYALTAAQGYSERGLVRSVAIALNTAAQAAAAINDHVRRDDYSRQAEQLATDHGYPDLAQSAINIRSHETALEAFESARNPPPLHQLSPEQLRQLLNGLLESSPLTPQQRSICRPIQEDILADDVYLSSQREEWCQYLELLKDMTGPQFGPFDTQQPARSVVCRLRGINLIKRHRMGQPLIRLFKAAFCSSCDLRSPAATRRQHADADDEIYAPMLERIRRAESDAENAG